MWMVKTKNGIAVTEAQVRYWDNVSTDIAIESIALSMPRKNAPPYIIEMKDYELYCVERVGVSMEGANSVVGYCLSGMKNGQVFQIEVQPAGMRLKSHQMKESSTPDRCWRRGF